MSYKPQAKPSEQGYDRVARWVRSERLRLCGMTLYDSLGRPMDNVVRDEAKVRRAEPEPDSTA